MLVSAAGVKAPPPEAFKMTSPTQEQTIDTLSEQVARLRGYL